MKEEYYVAGDRDLMNAAVKTKEGGADDVYPVTKPVLGDDLGFAIDLLVEDKIRWVVKKIENSRGPVKFVLFRSWKGLQFRRV